PTAPGEEFGFCTKPTLCGKRLFWPFRKQSRPLPPKGTLQQISWPGYALATWISIRARTHKRGAFAELRQRQESNDSSADTDSWPDGSERSCSCRCGSTRQVRHGT